MPVHEIKIDRSFVAAMATDSPSAAIVSSTVDLAHALGLRVVAEGIEDEATWRRLRDVGCDAAQGYHLSRPLPVAEFEAAASRSPSARAWRPTLPPRPPNHFCRPFAALLAPFTSYGRPLRF
jgi:EAL domain-containing protein (putative c-di-GMP-specific phosphodiesterase class I)